MLKPFSPLEMPSQGRQLIEASAGTGKTYTITSLYLRWILGIGCARPHEVHELLIVTFTRAATEELRSRIRKKLRDASLAAGNPEAEADPLIKSLLQEVSPQQAELLLHQAVHNLEEAAIYTLHSFCGRLLKEFALATGSLVNHSISFGQDQEDLLRHAAADVYQQWISEKDRDEVQAFREKFRNPDKLLDTLKPMLRPASIQIKSPPKLTSEKEQSILQTIEKAKKLWLEKPLAEGLLQADLHGASPLLRSANLQAFTRYAESSAIEFTVQDKSTKRSFELFARSKIRTKKTTRLPESEFFDLMEDLKDSFPAYKTSLDAERLKELRCRFKQRLEQIKDPALLSTDDLAGMLRKQISAAPDLRDRIAGRYPIAMVDEFQDTDEEQLGLFEEIYSSTGCLLAIGDPKQGIYAFRNADVYTYLSYRRSMSEVYNLTESFRSEARLLEVINHVFSRENAFLTGQDIPYAPVSAHYQNRRQLLLHGEEEAALSCCFHEDELTSLESRKLLLSKAAAQTAELLQSGIIRERMNEADTWKERKVQPGDIAFLVRSIAQANEVREALSKLGISSIQNSRSSVFASDTAQDVILLLRALLNPKAASSARAVCASELFRWTLPEIQASISDDTKSSQLEERFEKYKAAWEQQGILPMLSLCLKDTAPGLVTLSDGERRLTDLRHLGELLQEQQGSSGGRHQLLDWLVQQCETALENEKSFTRRVESEEREHLHLESDQNLVKLMTMHGCKGLEFEIVMLPFGRFGTSEKLPRFHLSDGDRYSVVYDLAAGDEAREAADLERLADDIRLLYVAMTRAKLALYMGIGKQKSGRGVLKLPETAIGSLLQLDDSGSLGEQLSDRFASLAVSLQPLVDFSAAPLHKMQKAPQLQLHKPANPVVREAPGMLSYSSLIRGRKGGDAEHRSGVSDEAETDFAEEAAPLQDALRDILPAGAAFGSFVHQLLEVMNQDFSDAKLDEWLPRLMQRYGIETEDARIQKMKHWIIQTGKTELLPLNISLDELPASRCRQEMEFHLSLPQSKGAWIEDLNKLLSKAGCATLDTDRELHLTGFMKGFIDLTFEAEGKLFVADYKSNLLASSSEDYTRELLAECMAKQHYDLQLLLYSLAAHRYLGQKPGYSYDEHFGGGFWLFLRGMDSTAGRGVYFAKPAADIISELDGLMTGGPQ